MTIKVLYFALIALFFSFVIRAEEPLPTISHIDKWIDYFQPSTLTRDEMRKELQWFQSASKQFKGKQIRSIAEDIKTHYWERDVLSKAFEEITGIIVDHEIKGEGTVVQRMTEQLKTGRIIYEIYVNDADLIGTHLREKGVVNLTDYMKRKGRKYTNPMLDLSDFMNLEFGQDYDGNQLQIPDQQFANLYWFRYDWFTRDDIKKQFKDVYGYELGVPLNWAAYEDIAEFFTNTPIDGKKVYGHLDYGKKSPSLGWRFTDAWLSIAGVGDHGLPNGYPVDEWGIRVEGKIPVGSSVSRGGATNGPAAVYALTKYIEWMEKYSPPESKQWRWVDAGPKAARGDIAQRIFQYITWLSDEGFHSIESPVVNDDGTPRWRVAPTPHGRYWDKGMKVGYQDAGSWTIPANVKGQRRAIAWLWAQFCISKTVSLKKFLIGGTPVRKSTVFASYLDPIKYRWGGIIDFYRSPQERLWTDSGVNVPHYQSLSTVWWLNISKAIQGYMTPQQAMNAIADTQDQLMSEMKQRKYGPRLNDAIKPEIWISRPGSPKPVRLRPKPETILYEDLILTWRDKLEKQVAVSPPAIIKIGITPWKSEESLLKTFKPLMEYLSRETGTNAQLTVCQSYDELGVQIKKREIDIGLFSPLAYVKAKDADPGLIYMNTYLKEGPTGDIQDSYKGLIFSLKDSPFKTLNDLKGRKFGFTEKSSASGYVYPLQLLKEKGIEPSSFFSKTLMLKRHDNVTRAVANNLIEAGATWSGNLKQAIETYGDIFHVIAETSSIPFDAVAAGSHVPKKVRDGIARSLSSIKPGNSTYILLKKAGSHYDGFSIKDDQFYDTIRKVNKMSVGGDK